MAQLKVRLRGKIVSEISLQEGQAYIAGRKEDSSILLQPEKGISREHFQISYESGKWELKLLSRFGDLLVGGEKVQNLTLPDSQVFSVPPYEFEFLNTQSSAPEVDAQDQLPPAEPVSEGEAALPTFEAEERTVVGAVTLIPILKMLDSFQTVKKTIDLDQGDVFVAGREPTSQIHIDDQRVSRRQFEIKKINGSFLITDLGSVNGTYLNGQMLPQNEPAPLRSGDVITVLDNQIIFELHDPNFQKIVMENNRALTPVDGHQNNWAPVPTAPSPMGGVPAHYDPNLYPPAPYVPPSGTQQPSGVDEKTKKIRIAIAVGAVVILGALFFGGGEDEKIKSEVKSNTQASDPLAKLDNEQKMMVKHHYQLAENYLAQQKWMLAKGEIEKIKILLMDDYVKYERTADLEMTAEQGLNSEREIQEIEQREQIKMIQEQKIQDQVAECSKKVHNQISKEEMENCLQPVLQFNPEHSLIVNLRRRVDQIVADRAIRDSEKKEQDRLAAQLRALYEAAEAQERNKNYLEAIKSYEKVQRASLPDRGNYKSKAQRQVAAIKSKMTSQTSSLMANAEKMAGDRQYKQAILYLREAKKVDPTNIILDEKISYYIRELKKEMLVIFQEGVLEESFGNIEGSDDRPGAKALWKKVLEQDIPDGEYYQKAKQRLKKYGAF